MIPPSRPPTLALHVELEGPVRLIPVCSSYEEESRLAVEVLARSGELMVAAGVWAEEVLAGERRVA